MPTHHKIICGDSRNMGGIADSAIHLVVTSPPYWQLKDYGERQQIGYDETYEAYIASLNRVWGECIRVLHNGCRLCINIGDQFARSVYYGRYKVIPIRSEIIRYCESKGMDYMGAVIWQKVTTTHTTGGGSVMGSFPYPRNGILKIDYEFILVFKKPGEGPKVPKDIKELSKLTTEEWNTYFAGHWNFPGERQAEHLAAFPAELPRRLIRMFSFVGDTVLDPFLGSGTTTLVAGMLDRNSIGYEINRRFIPVIRKKLGIKAGGLSGQDVEFVTQHGESKTPAAVSTSTASQKLMRRPGTVALRFGSSINHADRKRKSRTLKVEEVLSASRVRLNDGTTIRLLGVVENPARREDAIGFLTAKAEGREVFLRGDTEERDEQGDRLSYLYLKNKTFVNAHMIKSGLVYVDTSREYKYQRKFRSLAGVNERAVQR